MAVKKETTIERFTGLSTDIKPTSVRVGSTFFEYDTKLLYFTYDGTNWVIKHLPYGLIFAGTCNSGMTASTVTVASADLAGYGNDYFNGNFYMQVVKNASSIGSAPDGDFPRKITDYVSSSGTFTVDAFSANVEESDEIFVLHKSIMLILTEVPEVGDWALSDYDLFDVADADADNERWNPEYISGATGGSADINTSTSGKLHVHAAYNVAGAIRYAVSHNLPFYGDFFKVEEDVSITWGSTASATAKAVGILISAGTAYDSNNYIAIERQKGTGVDRVQVRYNLNNAGEVTVNAAVAVTDDTVAFKIERMDQTWSLFYSTIQMANGVWDWVKVTQVEDTSNYMTNQFTYYQEAFNGAAGDANESAIGDFDNFYYHLGTGGGSQYVAGDYSSAWVSADVDGSVFERLESIQQALSVNASGEFEQDGSPDLWDALVIDSSSDANIVLMTGNRDGAIIERLAAVENTIGITNAATLTGYEEDGTGANLFKTLVAVQGVTTAAGSTSTFIDTARVEGSGYWIGNLIVDISGSAVGQIRTIVGDNGTGTLTVEPLLSAAPGSGKVYVILKTKCSDWIIGDNTANNAYSSSNVVFNSDGSVLERLEHLLVAIGGTTGTTTSEGTTTTAISTTLIQAADYWNGAIFICVDGTNAGLARPIYDFIATSDTVYFEPGFPNLVASGVNYLILTRYDVARIIGDNNADNAIVTSAVVRNDDGSVLERLESIIEDLRGTGGIATWPGAADIADGVSFAEGLRAVLTSMVGSSDYDGYTNLSNTANASLNAVAQKFGAVIGIDATNTYSTTLQGSARTTIETSFDGLGAYFSTSGAAWSVQMNNAAAVTTLETTLEGYLAWIGIDGTNQLTKISNVVPTTFNTAIQAFASVIGIDGTNTFSTSIQGSARTTIEGAFDGLADYISPSGAAWSVQINNAGATEDIETTLEGFFTWIGINGTNQLSKLSNVTPTTLNAVIQSFATTIGIDGTNTFSVTVNGGSQTTLEGVGQALATDLEHLYALADGGTNAYPDSVVQESILAYIMSKSTDPVVTSYVNTTDSLEMLSDKMGTYSGNGGATVADSVKAALDVVEGQVYKGTVTTATDLNNFASTDLIGFGDGAFIGWSVFVFRDAVGAGGAPQQQDVVPITGYTSSTGAFIHTAFASGTLATNDEIVIVHPSIAAIGDRTITGATGAVTTTDSLMAYVKQIVTNTYRLGETTDGINNYPNSVVNGSVLAKILSKTAIGGDITDYDCTTDSLEALSDKIGAEYDGSPDVYDTIVTGYDSSSITANADGSALERLEFIQSSLIPDTGGLSFKGTVSTGGSVTSNKIAGLIGYGDDYFNTYYYMQIIRTTDGLAPVGEVRKITDYTSTDGTFATDAFSVILTTLDEAIIIHESVVAIGRDDGDNTISTSVVVANENGSILERLEQIQEAVNIGTGSGLPANKSLYDIIGVAYVDAGGGFGTDSVISDLADIHTHVDDIDTDLGEPADAAAIPGAGTVNAKLTGLGTAIGVVASGAGSGFEIDGTPSLYGALTGSVDAVNRAVGKLQTFVTTVDLHNGAGTTTIATGTTQGVTLEALIFSPRINVSDDIGAFTSVSIQTNHTTAQTIISSAMGVKANLTAEAQLGWTGKILLQTGKLIQLTINGGTADDDPTTCDVIIQFRANINGAYLV